MTRFLLALALASVLSAGVRAQPAYSVQLRLAGTTTTGATVADEAALVRFLPNALPGQDAFDAGKLFPPAATYALIALVGERDGQPFRLSVNSLPDGSPGFLTAPVTVPMDFYTTNAGSFTIRIRDNSDFLPPGWDLTLRDAVTGAVINLRQQGSYAFTSDALADFVPRFQLVFTPRSVTQTGVADAPGWRLLSAPVLEATVTSLARINLVQGVPAGTPPAMFPAQYPLAGPNLYTSFDGAYARPATTGEALEPGRGFFWYFYDADIAPTPGGNGGGTSRSRDLAAFTLGAYGIPPAGDVTRTFPRTPSGFVMAGNPFGSSFRLSGLSATGGTLSTVVQVYDPAGPDGAPTYQPLFQSNPTTGLPDAAAPWQGFFAEVTGVSAGTSPALTYAASAITQADAPFYGRSGFTRRGVPDALAVHLTLRGTTAAGPVRDEAAWVRLRDGAQTGWDADDAGKLTPLAAPDEATALLGLLAPVGTRGGAAERQSVLALPIASTTVPVAFTATAAGAFEIRWDEALVPSGWTVTLRDVVRGETRNLATDASYSFEAPAGDWAERFELRLEARATASEPAGEATLSLGAPVPNPASGVSRLRLTTAQTGRVTATVVDALGRTLLVAFDGDVAAGVPTEIRVDAHALAPGTYSVRVVGAGAAETRRFVVVR